MPEGEDGVLDYSLSEAANKAQGSPRLSKARLQTTEASPSSRDKWRPIGEILFLLGPEAGQGEVGEMHPSLDFAAPRKSSSFRPMFKEFTAMTRQVCPSLSCQFILVMFNCTGAH